MKSQCTRSAVDSAVRVAMFMCVCGAAFAQNAAVSGRVNDTSGGVIPNVSVELINQATKIKSSTLTNPEGIFVFPSVPPGVYDMNAAITGFTASRVEAVTLEVGQSKSFNLTLTPGDVKQSVTVTDEAPLVTTNRADRGTVVENQFVTSIPLLTQTPLLLAPITAGAIGTATPGGGLVAGDNTVSENQTNYFRINGGRNRSNEI